MSSNPLPAPTHRWPATTQRTATPAAEAPGFAAAGAPHPLLAGLERSPRMALQRQTLARLSPGVAQRAYDDKKVMTVARNDLSAVWSKLKQNAVGGNGLPNFASADVRLGNQSPQTVMNPLLNLTLTERALVEAVSEIPAIRSLLVGPRVQSPAVATVPPNESLATTTERVITSLLYYHATFTENVPAIMEGGLKASKGGKGTGVSTHARSDEGGGVDAQATYNKWSEAHVFFTAVKSEAEGYRTSMQLKAGKPAQLIHVLSQPDWSLAEAMPDVDSKAGLKVKGDMRFIGDGVTLNTAAMNMVRNSVQTLRAERPDPGTVTTAYVAVASR